MTGPMIEGYGQWAQTYRLNLWTGVLPLPARKKTPPPGGYTGRKATKTVDDAQVAEWVRTHAHGNLCLRMPSDVIGIDVDDYEYTHQAKDPDTGELLTNPDGTPLMVTGVKTGNITLGALEDELGHLPPTWRSSSRGDGPSGIRFYRVPPGLLWGDFGEHLEGIWWGHRYAVVWPSVNPDSGMRYLWINDAEDDPMWGCPPPKVTDLPELPESWVARFGRPADTPKLPTPVAVPDRRPPTVRDDDGRRAFTRQQAADFVQPHLDALRSASGGTINNRLNDAAAALSHFVPGFWSPVQAQVLLMDALSATIYDGKTWQAHATIASGLATASWAAELVSEPVRPPGGARTRPRDSEDDPWPTEAPDDPTPPEAAGFWDARHQLAYVRDFALHRYAAPWGVLGAVLARVAAAVEPNIQLPAIIGTEASLNLFVGLVGPSGGGKDVASGVAKALLLPMVGRDPLPVDVIPLGSGEGLSHIYMRPPQKVKSKGKGDDDSAAIGLGFNPDPDAPVQYRTRALVNVSEIDTLGSLSERTGSTVGGQLRQAWSGQQLGFQYVAQDKRMIVPEHSYRMCLTAGIQPGRAGGLLGETDGGTPQRFLWLPAVNPQLEEPTDEQIDNPPPGMASVEWQPPQYQAGRALYVVCPTARRTIVRAHVARGRGDGDALDGHSLLNRLKTAAALALLCGDRPQRQCEITEEDWELAGAIMAVSDATRAGVQRALADAAREENMKKAVAEAHRNLVIADEVESAGMRRVLRALRGKLGSEWTPHSDMKDWLRSDVRKLLNDALDRLVAAGEIESSNYTTRTGQVGRQFRKRPAVDGE